MHRQRKRAMQYLRSIDAEAGAMLLYRKKCNIRDVIQTCYLRSNSNLYQACRYTFFDKQNILISKDINYTELLQQCPTLVTLRMHTATKKSKEN
jgi:hypothetical protein